MQDYPRLIRSTAALVLTLSVLSWFILPAQAENADVAQPLIASMQNGNIWLMNADGSDQRAITDDAAAEYQDDGTHYPWYEWSPDGQYLLIVKEQRAMNAGPPNNGFLIYDAASGEVRTLVGDLGPIAFYPSWALDANQIVFVSADPLTGTGDNYSLSTLDPEGTVTPLVDISGPACNLPSGNPTDPAYDLYLKEFGPFSGMILDRSIFWRSAENDLWFDTRCGTAIYGAIGSGEQIDTGLDQIVVGPGGLIAGTTSAASHGGDIVIASEPGGGDQRVLRNGGTPAWAMGSGDLFFVTIGFGTEYMNLTPADGDLLPALSLTFNRSALWLAPANGSEPVKLVDRAAYAFGEPSPAADGSFVVFTRIENASELWENRLAGDTYTQALLDEFGPEARIQGFDRESGQLSTLATNAFRPRVQPVGATPVSG
jgi:hypothetical protein